MKMNSYELSRSFTDWCFSNPEKVKPIHYAIYFFAIEHCNRLGWKDKFGFPSQMVMEAIGVKNWRTYSSGLDELVEFGFIEMIEISKNQYSSNIIAIVKNTKASTKALDKALSKHSQKQHTKHSQSTVSIIKQEETNNNEQLNNLIKPKINFSDLENSQWFEAILRYLQFKISQDELMKYWKQFQEGMIADDDLYRDKEDYRSHFRNWVKIQIDNNDKKNRRTNGFNSPETSEAIAETERIFSEHGQGNAQVGKRRG